MVGPFGRAAVCFGCNLIRWLLILTIGVLVPLSYVDNYSPHVGLRTFHFSLFESPNLRRPLPEVVTMALKTNRTGCQVCLLAQTAERYVPSGPGFIRCLQQHFGHGYLLPNLSTWQDTNAGVGLRCAPVFQGQSAWLSPPDRPPAALFR
jgi:hypothetical protein